MSGFQSLPGFRDFYPEALSRRAHILSAWREAARRFGFEEYDGPPLEPLELYIEKSGEEIVEQLYAFTDKGGRDVALRPEMTPTLARMAGARARGLTKPIRWFSVPQLFRYERTQRGRLREHFQWNVDIIGEEDVAADAEVLATGLEALRLLGLSAGEIVARVSDRRLVERIILDAGVAPERLAGAYAALDKLERDEPARVAARLVELGVAQDRAQDLVSFFSAGADLDAVEARYREIDGLAAEIERLRAFFRHIDALGFAEFARFDPRIVRGLAYYTGVVFEIFDRAGELRAISGGGRYDRLLGALSGEELPAVGFGMGDVVLGELLEERGLLPEYAPRADYYLVAIGAEQRSRVLSLAQRLRERGHSALYALRGSSVGRQFKDAGARGAARVVVIGPEEVEAGVVVVRDMGTGEERRVPESELVR